MSLFQKGSFSRRVVIELAIASFCVFISWVTLQLLGDGLVKFTDNADKMYYLNLYYDKHNRANNHGNKIHDVFFINCHDDSTDSLVRERIATAIERVILLEPRQIGIDIRFKGLHNKREDSFLEKTILSHKDKIVITRSITGDKENRSFFDRDSSQLKYGYTNVGDFYSTVSYYNPSFAMAILSESGLLNSKFIIDNGIINFSLLQPRPLDLENFLLDDINDYRSLIKDHIVIFGDKDDEKDQVLVPFLVNGEEKMPGVYYHLYCINSMKVDGDYYFDNEWISILLCLFLTAVYSMIAMLLNLLVKSFSIKSLHLIGLLVKPIILFWLWYKIPVVLMLFTTWFGFVPNLTLALLSVAGITFLDNFFEELKLRLL